MIIYFVSGLSVGAFLTLAITSVMIYFVMSRSMKETENLVGITLTAKNDYIGILIAANKELSTAVEDLQNMCEQNGIKTTEITEIKHKGYI